MDGTILGTAGAGAGTRHTTTVTSAGTIGVLVGAGTILTTGTLLTIMVVGIMVGIILIIPADIMAVVRQAIRQMPAALSGGIPGGMALVESALPARQEDQA